MTSPKNPGTVSISHGICGGGFFPGGGYSRSPEALKDEIQKAAVLLMEHFPNDITVRCNSHGESGGAYLVGPQGDTFNAQDQAGIGVALDESGHFRYDALIMKDALARPEFGNQDGGAGHRYGWYSVGSLAEALQMVQDKACVPVLAARGVTLRENGRPNHGAT